MMEDMWEGLLLFMCKGSFAVWKWVQTLEAVVTCEEKLPLWECE
jgi:hypothetical protein